MPKFSALVAAISLGALGALAVPAAASAHTGTLDVAWVCASDGTREVTYSGSTSNVPTDGAGHVAQLTVTEIEPARTTVTPTVQTVTGDTDYSFTQVVPGDATAAGATASLEWGDGAVSDPRGEVTFDTACDVSPPVADASASATSTPGTCTTAGSVTFSIEHATWDDATDTTDGSRTATADAGHTFPDGTTTATVTYTTPERLDPHDVSCLPDLTPTVTHTTDVVCGDSDAVDTTTTTTPTYTLDGYVWVRGADTVTTTSATRALSSEEQTQCPPLQAKLAATGSSSDSTPIMIGGLVLLVAGAAVALTGRLRPKRRG